MRVCPRCKSVYASKTQFCGIDGERLVTATEDPLIGESLGRYRVEQKIGQGASGGVYRAVHTELGAEFAVKVLLGELGSDEEVVGRFRREAKAASRIRSANVVSVMDVGTTEAGLTYLVMEYARGRPLDKVIKEEAPFPAARAARVVRDVAAGLSVAHGLGFVHRDIKPANIYVADEGGREVAKILDFGIVRLEGTNDATKLTQEGQVIGTPAYMSPEQWNKSTVGAASDLYALGIVLIEMLTGKKPFTGATMIEVLGKHLQEPPPKLPPAAGLDHLAYRLVAKTPAGRPASAHLVVQEAEEILATMSIEHMGARPPSSVPARPPSSSPTVAAPQELLQASSMSRSMAASSHSTSQPSSRMHVGRSGISASAAMPRAPTPDLAMHHPGAAEAAPMLVDTMGLGRTHNNGSIRDDITASRKKRRTMMAIGGAAAGLVTVAVIAVVVVRGSSSNGGATAATVQVPARRSIADLEKQLDQRLEARGLSRSDLDGLASIAPMVVRWKAVVGAGDVEGANKVGEELIKAVETAPIGASLVREKLDRLDTKLAEVAGLVSEEDRKALEQKYLDLYKAVGSHPQAGFGSLILEVTAFAAELDKKKKDAPPPEPD